MSALHDISSHMAFNATSLSEDTRAIMEDKTKGLVIGGALGDTIGLYTGKLFPNALRHRRKTPCTFFPFHECGVFSFGISLKLI